MFCPLTKDQCNKECVFFVFEQTPPLTVFDLDLSVRSTNLLRSFLPGCEKPLSVKEWKSITAKKLKAHRGIGKRTIKEITNAIYDLEYDSAYGYCLVSKALEKYTN